MQLMLAQGLVCPRARAACARCAAAKQTARPPLASAPCHDLLPFSPLTPSAPPHLLTCVFPCPPVRLRRQRESVWRRKRQQSATRGRTGSWARASAACTMATPSCWAEQGEFEGGAMRLKRAAWPHRPRPRGARLCHPPRALAERPRCFWIAI